MKRAKISKDNVLERVEKRSKQIQISDSESEVIDLTRSGKANLNANSRSN